MALTDEAIEFEANEVVRIKSDLHRQRHLGVMPAITFHFYEVKNTVK